MSESPEDKSKRLYCQYLSLADWRYQYSFFYDDQEIAKEYAIQEGATLRKALARAFKDQPFLYRLALTTYGYKAARGEVDEETGEIIQLPKEKGVVVPFHMFLTTQELNREALGKLLKKQSLGGINTMLYRTRTDDHIRRYGTAVRNQKPHNLKRFFGDKKINRIALLNKKAIL